MLSGVSMAVRTLTQSEIVNLKRFARSLVTKENRILLEGVQTGISMIPEEFCRLVWGVIGNDPKERMPPFCFEMLVLLAKACLFETESSQVGTSFENTASWFRHWSNEVENYALTVEQNKILYSALRKTIRKEGFPAKNNPQGTTEMRKLRKQIKKLRAESRKK